MERHLRRFSARHWRRRLYRWRRAAALSVIGLVAWLARAPERPQRPGVAVRPGQ
jgi:hypothetical protein